MKMPNSAIFLYFSFECIDLLLLLYFVCVVKNLAPFGESDYYFNFPHTTRSIPLRSFIIFISLKRSDIMLATSFA